MGLLSYLQRKIASFIRPWILQKDLLEPVLLHFHLFKIVLELQSLELDCDTINSSSSLSSSPFLLRQACVQHAKLTISFFRSPGVFLSIGELHFAGDIRPAEDSFWLDRQKQIAQNKKREAVLALDSQGAAVHAAAERHSRKKADTWSLKTFFTSVFLQALRIEVFNGSTSCHLDAMDGGICVYTLHLENLVVEEESGLAGAAIRKLANVLRQVDETFCKLCSVQKFGLRLETSKEGTQHVQKAQPRDVSGRHPAHIWISKGYVLLWKRVSFIIHFQNDQVTGVEAFVAETMLEVSLADMEAYVLDAIQSQDISRRKGTSHELTNGRNLLTRGRYLWLKASEKINHGSWKKFKNAVDAGMLRQRYIGLYVLWLLKAGEGLFVELKAFHGRKRIRREKLDLKSLEKDLLVLEQELSVEAIVLARSLAQHRVVKVTHEHGVPARTPGVLLLSRVVSCLPAIWRALKRSAEFLITTLKGSFRILYIYVNRVLTSIGFYWLYSRCIYGMTAVKNKFLASSTYLESQSSEEGSETMEGCLEGPQERRLLMIQNMTGHVNFSGTFHTGSLTFIDSLDYGPVDGVRKGLKSSFPALTGVQFSWGNASVAYMSSADVVGLNVVFGHLQAAMVTFSVSYAENESFKNNTDGRRLVLSEKSEGAKFLQSNPAPQTCIPESIQNHLGPGDISGGGQSPFIDFLEKEKAQANFAENIHGDYTQPFLSFSSEKTQTNVITPEKHSDMSMCCLAVGCLECNLDLDTFIQLGMLLARFVGVMSANEHPSNEVAHQTTLTTNTSNIPGLDWQSLYTEQLKQFISTIVIKKRTWLLTAIDCPKLQFSGFFDDLKESDNDAAIDNESVLVVCLGHVDAIVWPAKAEQDSPNLEKLDDVIKWSSSEKNKPKVWVRPPSLEIQGEKVIEKSFRHEQITSNGLLSVQGTVMILQAKNGVKQFSLAGPMKMIWEFSMCRHQYFSSFGVCELVSVAALGSFSGSPSGIILDDISLMSKVSESVTTVYQKFSDLKRFKRSDDGQMIRQEDSGTISSTYSVSNHFQPSYFAISVEIQVDKLDCFLMEKRESKSGKTSQKDAHQRRFYINDRLHLSEIQEGRFNWLECFGEDGNVDQFLVKEISFKFSWGDGRELLASSGFEEVSLSIAKVENGALTDSGKQESLSNDWKSGGTVALFANERCRRAKGKCHLVIQQCLLNFQQPWCFSDTLDDTGAHKSFLGFELKKLHLTDCESESLINKALSRTTSAVGLSVDVTMSRSFESISVISKGGVLVLHAQALLLLLQEWQNVLSFRNASLEVNTVEVLSQSTTNRNELQEITSLPPPSFGKSSSLPSQYTQMKQLKHRRLYSAPMDLSTIEEDTFPKVSTWLLRSFSLEVLGLNLLVAQTSSTSTGKDPEGFLLEMGAKSNFQRTVKVQTISFETNKLSLCSLQSSQSRYTGRAKRQASQLPRFGSTSSLAADSSNTTNVRDSLRSMSDAASQFANEGMTVAKTKHLMSRNASSMMEEGLSREKTNDFIVENLSISLGLENNAGYLSQSGSSDGWRGSCSFLDIDVGITTSEIQLLLTLLSSFSGLSSGPKNDTVKKSRDSQVTYVEQVSDHVYEVPDGSIVTVKDAHEHLYMAVDKAEKKFRLVGVLHHSLAGDRALFKVKYQKNSRDSVSWFSLSSVGAKNADGEHFRVHYRPGSGLADISSIHDGSWELWQTVPYKYSAREDDGDIDLYSDLNNKLVYLINQKSKQGLTLASGNPMMVKKPGSPFKIKVMRTVGIIDNTFAQLELRSSIDSALEREDSLSVSLTDRPKVEINMGKIIFTLLFETGGGKHVLPLLRGRLEDAEAVMHMHADKFRLIGDCKFVLEYLEAHVDKWSAIVQPVDIGLFYRLRTDLEAKNERAKLRTSFFTRCEKMDIAISETSLDMMLFVIGILNLAGPYTIKHSPVLATSCMVENHTGLDLCCHFDTKDHKEVLKIPAWKTETFFVRNMISRRDLLPANVLSSVAFSLEKESIGRSLPVHTSLAEPSITAIRTRLERKVGHKKSSGPIIVVDVSKQSEDGIVVTVSPMIRIHNASGLSLELRCRRPVNEGEGAIVMLKDGDMVDDSMGAFDALSLAGERKKALSSFSLGDYLLSIRPAGPRPASNQGSASEGIKVTEFDWSEDIKGAKPIRISGFFEKLQYGLSKSLKGRNTSDSFGTVFCGTSARKCEDGNLESIRGKQILVRSTCRYVPLSTMNSSVKQEGKSSVVAWQEQRELVLLPTLRVYNFLDSKISLMYCTSSKGIFESQTACKLHIEQAGQVFMYADLSDLAFSVEIDKFKLTSKYVSIGEWSKSSERSSVSTPADHLKELEMDLDFGDDSHYAKIKFFRGSDGVLQVLVYTQYALRNKSDTALLCCVPKQSRYFWAPWKKGSIMQWPSGEDGVVLQPGTNVSLLTRSSLLLLRVDENSSETSSLDLDSFSGSTELSLNICHENGVTEQVQLGVRMEITEAGNIDPTRIICIGSRYIASNQSPEAIFICQDGFQEDESATFLLKAGEHIFLRTRHLPGHKTNILGQSKLVEPDLTNASICSVRLRLQENGWDWTGPVCASALGSFSLRIRKSLESFSTSQPYLEIDNEAKYKFLAVDVEEKSPSLVVRFRLQSPDTVPYRIENSLSQSSIFFYQKGLDDTVTTLEPGKVIGYAWDDLSKPHKLVLSISGTQVCNEVKLDKLNPWRSFRAVRLKKSFGLQLPFADQFDENDGADRSQNVDPSNVGYEISADGSQRVLRVCENVKSSKLRQWQSHISFPSARIEFRIPIFGITLFEIAKQRNNAANVEIFDDMSGLSPIISMRTSSLFMEVLNTQKHILLQLKVQTLNIDEKWQGAPFAAMVRVHSEDRFKKGETVLHMAAIISNQVFDPIHVKYSSILLQAIDVNLDEETLMKLVPFYRYSLAESTSSRQFYFERLEIHPIKIVASFLPGQPLADYSSAQETFRALLHSFIKVPSIRGSNVELNGVLLSHALLTFRQLAIKCAQHYSWYAMRAVYIAKGSKLLPPAFASVFDDSAASSLDVFFDPSSGSIDLQGLTLGMFNLLSEGLNKRGFSGTSRYIGDLERTMKTAGSNILFAVMTELSDNVLKGAETGGLDGMVNGFRRGILNVSMEPSLLRTAIVKGGSSRRIKLDRSAGIDETYVEGYLQAMLDTAFKQDYLKVKVVDDQVLLKNLPPSSVLIDEILESVKAFLIREGLLVGEASASAMHSLSRLQGENDKRIVPAVVALSEQLFVIFAVRALRNQTRSWFRWGFGTGGVYPVFWGRHNNEEEKTSTGQPEPEGGQENRRGIRGIMLSFVLSSAMAYIDGRLCRHIPNTLARRVVSGFLLSFVE